MKKSALQEASRGGVDPALVARAKAGDRAAFTELYEQTNPALYRTVRAMVRDENLAWDVLQDSYLRAFQSLDKLEADGAFLPWLRRIAVNETARQTARRLPLRFSDLSGEEDDGPELPDPDPESQPELALDRKESARLVREILAKLPPQQQLIVGMRYYEDMPIREIAETLGVTPGTVKTQLHLGRKKVETEVRALEQQGVKLYGLGPVPFLMALIRGLEPTRAVERKALGTVLSQLPAAAETAGTVTAQTAGQAFFSSLGVKLAAGVLALAMIGGGIWAGVRLLGNSGPEVGPGYPTETVDTAEELIPVPTPPTEPIHASEPTEPSEAPTTEPPEELTAEPTEEPTTEPVSAFATAEEAYDYVLEQYRLALANPDFTPEAYPLVNAEAVTEAVTRRDRYADVDFLLYQSRCDIDGDGTPELLIERSVEDFGACICAIYAFDGTGPVELLGGLGLAWDDLVTVYENGIILWVENGYFVSPAQVAAYRLDPETCALREEGRWTYACTEEDGYQFTNDDGALNQAEFYGALGRCAELTGGQELPLALASEDGEALPVAALENVPDPERHSLPRITLKGEAYEAFNEAVRTELLSLSQTDPDWWDNIWLGYSWSLNGDILCVWIEASYPGGWNPWEKVAVFSLSEARELTEDELLERVGVSREDVEAGMAARLCGAFAREWVVRIYSEDQWEAIGPGYGFESELRLMRENRGGEVKLVLDRRGRLVCHAEVASMAGGAAYYYRIPVLP